MRVFTGKDKDDLKIEWDYTALTGVLKEQGELEGEQYLVYPEMHGALLGWVVARYVPSFSSSGVLFIHYPGVIKVNGYFPSMDLAVKFARCLEVEIQPEVKGGNIAVGPSAGTAASVCSEPIKPKAMTIPFTIRSF